MMPTDFSTASAEEKSVELSARRTGMSFQRTRMSADRTLMSVIRTALSLIGFGFTIFQFFEKLRDAGTLTHDSAPRHFGISLVLLGIAMLVLGIWYHVAFMLELRRHRQQFKLDGLIHAESGFPPSMVLIVAILLLVIGLVAGFSMIWGGGLLG
jgi:putative membrane protein